MVFGWGILSSLLVQPAYVGMWLAALAIITSMLFIYRNLIEVRKDQTTWQKTDMNVGLLLLLLVRALGGGVFRATGHAAE